MNPETAIPHIPMPIIPAMGESSGHVSVPYGIDPSLANEPHHENCAPTYDDIFPALPESDSRNDTANVNQQWMKRPAKPSNITQVFRVAPEERRYRELNSRFGEAAEQSKICADIMQKTGANIEMSISKDGTLTFLINGKEEAVLSAKRMISSELQTQASASLAIPKEHHRFILGKSGNKLNLLEQNTGTKIYVPRQNDASDQIKILGTKEAIDKAVHEIQLISNEAASRSNERVNIPKIYHPFICGPFNKTINEISNETGAKINIPPPSVNKEEISITGERDAVIVAKNRIMEIYRDREKKCQTVSMEVRKSQHKYIVGSRGHTLQEIFDETGVSVEMPSPDSNTETITLRGEQEKLGRALNVLYEKAHSEVETEIDVPSWCHKYILGPKGAKFHEISQEFKNVHVSFVTNQDRIKMNGPVAEVEKAKEIINKVIKEIMEKIDVKEVKVNPKYHRFIIGKNGANIKHIRDETGAHIHIPSETADSDVTNGGDMIRIEGPHHSVEKAKQELESIIKKMVEKENEVSKEIPIEQRFHKQLIGTKGESIRLIRDRFNQVVVVFPEPGVKSDKVTIRGAKKDVDQCYKHLAQLNKELLANNFRVEVPIYKQFHKFIIGKDGANIKRIRDETGTKVDLPAEGADSDMIVITGAKQNVESAKERIMAIQNELANVVQVDIIIPAKFHNYIIGAKGRQIRQIMDDCGGVVIRFPPEGSGSDKVSIRGPKDSVQKAKQQLIDISNEQQVNSFSVELKAKPEYHRYLIGKNGSNIKKVREKTGARIFFPSEKDDESPSDRETIVITGKKDDVIKAKDLLEESIVNLEKNIESEMRVSPKYHSHFVAKRGSILKQIFDDYGGVTISFPRPNQTKDIDKVILKGPKECIESAKQRINEIIKDFDEMTTIECVIDAQFHRTLMGTRGLRVQGITQEHDVRIKFPERGSGDDTGLTNGDVNGSSESVDKTRRKSDIIFITGKKENCEAAQNALFALIPITIDVDVPYDLHRFIIGQKGREVREMMEKYDVSIAVPPANANSDTIKITGPKENVEKAKIGVFERVEKLEGEKKDRIAKSHQISIRVNPLFHPKIIGRRGAVISKIREKYDVQIQFPELRANDAPGTEDDDLITIIGYEKNAEDAKEEIMTKVKEFEGSVNVEVEINSRVHPRLIGAKGKAIRRVMDQYKVDIRFPRKVDPNQNIVTIIGLEEDVDAARDHLLNLAEEYLDDVVEQYKSPRSRGPDDGQHRQSGDARRGFVVKGGPWEQTVPDTTDAQEFPSFCAEPAMVESPVAATEVPPKSVPKWGPKTTM